MTSRRAFPHPLILLLGGVLVAVALTWVLPAGAYERRTDEATGRSLVVPGTYAHTTPSPIGPMDALLTVPRGIVAGADVMLVIFFVGGAFVLLEKTGALGRLIGALVGSGLSPNVVLVIVGVVFASLGALENMGEEIVALVPVLLVLSRGLGFGAITAVSIAAGSAIVGSAFGPTNPFQSGLALKLAGLPAMSQPGLRFAMLGAAVAIWIAWTIANTGRDDVRPEVEPISTARPTGRDATLLAIAIAPFVPYVVGVLMLDWGFNELSGLFLVAGLLIGVVSGMSLSESASKFLHAMEPMVGAALFVGVARAISLALSDGQVLDTILHALATGLADAPTMLVPILMVPAHAILHVPVPSVSGQAALTMPIMAPLGDLLGVSRDAVVIAYQTGAGLCEMFTPTNGGFMAILLAARLDYTRWVRFALPGALLVALVGLAGILIAG